MVVVIVLMMVIAVVVVTIVVMMVVPVVTIAKSDNRNIAKIKIGNNGFLFQKIFLQKLLHHPLIQFHFIHSIHNTTTIQPFRPALVRGSSSLPPIRQAAAAERSSILGCESHHTTTTSVREETGGGVAAVAE